LRTCNRTGFGMGFSWIPPGDQGCEILKDLLDFTGGGRFRDRVPDAWHAAWRRSELNRGPVTGVHCRLQPFQMLVANPLPRKVSQTLISLSKLCILYMNLLNPKMQWSFSWCFTIAWC
jgi:hypothetical protein